MAISRKPALVDVPAVELTNLRAGAGPSGLVAAKTLLHNAPKGAFQVSVFDAQDGIGGLWPTSKTDTGRLVHPLMVANQSRHTMHFSDLAWDAAAPQLPRAWQVGKYLERYLDRYLTGHPDFELRLGTRIVRADPMQDGRAGWQVLLRGPDGTEETRTFQRLIVASGYFGKPIIPDSLAEPAAVPVVPSSQYRDLKSLLGDKPRNSGKKILVVGGQMSGVEIAGTIASHLSSAANSPDPCGIPDIEQYSVHHVVQRPIWVFPLYTTPEVRSVALMMPPAAPLTRDSLPLLQPPFFPSTSHRTTAITDHSHLSTPKDTSALTRPRSFTASTRKRLEATRPPSPRYCESTMTPRRNRRTWPSATGTATLCGPA